MGQQQRRSGALKGTAVEARRANAALGRLVRCILPIADDVVLAIRSAPPTVTQRSLAKLHGISCTSVGKIIRNESYRHLLPKPSLPRPAAMESA